MQTMLTVFFSDRSQLSAFELSRFHGSPALGSGEERAEHKFQAPQQKMLKQICRASLESAMGRQNATSLAA